MVGMTQDAILHMRIAHEFRAMLDGLRKGEADLPSRSEMVRRLIERAHKNSGDDLESSLMRSLGLDNREHRAKYRRA